MYTRLAALYDNPARDAISRAAAVKVLAALAEERSAAPEAGMIVDLACGTGLLAVELVARGAGAVIGIDLSEAMLELARARSHEAGVSIEWRQGDIRELALAGPARAVLCFGDVVNHLLDPADVTRTFAAVARVLTPGGLFLFDTSTRELFTSRLWSAEERVELEDGRVEQRASFDAASGLGVIETRVELRSGAGGGAEITSDTIEERFHAEDDVAAWLEAAGFDAVEREDWNPIDLREEAPEVGVQKQLWRAGGAAMLKRRRTGARTSG